MDKDQKNQLIEKYIRELAEKINNQYNDLIDEEKIMKAFSMFKDSSEDLETQIIPKINKLAQRMIEDYLEFQKHLMEIMKITGENKDNKLATLNLATKLNGIYLSQQQIDLLLITKAKSLEELKHYVENICGQFPYKRMEDIIENYKSIITEEQLEAVKKEIFKKYQDSLIDYLSFSEMTDLEKAKNKLEKFGITGAELQLCLSQVSQGKTLEVIEYLGKKYGSEFISKFNHFMNDDFENIKDVTYEEMKSLSDLIKQDESLDTIIIASGKFNNSVYQNIGGKTFDPYLTKKALDYCKDNGKHMRYHALFDHFYVDNFINQYIKLNGRSIEELSLEEINTLKAHKNEILSQMRWFIKESMDFINQNNVRLQDGSMLINEIEIFNELVEKNKKDKSSPYEMVWEKYFDINISDIFSCFPKDKKGKIIKPNGIKFMYNETTLTESNEKRKMVEKVLYQIEQEQPGIIDVFGDQMHLSDEDVLFEKGRKNLTETAQMLKRKQDGQIIVDNQIKTIISKKIECTEHDFHFTRDFIEKVKKIGNMDLWKIKNNMQRIIEKNYMDNGVNFERSTYWSLFGKNDHNLCRENVKSQKEKLPFIDTMYAGLIKDGDTFENSKTLKSQNDIEKNKKSFIAKSSIKGFDQRTPEEIAIAEQIKSKNLSIKEQKSQEKSLEKEKVRKLVKPINNENNTNNASNTKGFANAVIVTVITIIIAIIVAIGTLYFLK